ncbi:MAG: acyl carrier protein [Candidatus Omnitrophota bacterium]
MKGKIKKFIIENFLLGKGDLKDNQPLFEEGVIDSFGFVLLLSFLEKESNIHFDRSQITIDNFNSLACIMESIKNARSNKS